jgi:single-stranded DNA-specific DHH superfamily exonuclease
MQIDVFNGDADGICALVQLRLAQPVDSVLITGIKRDIELLSQVQATSGDKVTVLDISLASNHTHLLRVLDAGAEVFYVDHHAAGEIPQHPALKTLINTDANICTSLLVDQHLNGQFKAWAVTAAFGDNMDISAMQAAAGLGLTQSQLEQLKNLGICINYNGYGANVSDLHFPPATLYRELSRYASPFDFMTDNAPTYQKLLAGYADDMNQALQTPTEYANENVAVYILPDEAWSRRISGVFGNELANQFPTRAHAVLSINTQGGYLISVRAPLTNKTGADELCSAFPTGGGRKGAAGINHLPKEQLSEFIQRFASKYAV